VTRWMRVYNAAPGPTKVAVLLAAGVYGTVKDMVALVGEVLERDVREAAKDARRGT
jgi:hypothetical protein